MSRLFWLLAPLLTACSSNTFFVRSGDAVLPVEVRGNTDSGTVAVFVQGGPGGSAIDMRIVDYVDWEERLEPHFAIAYYDQAGTGNGLGDQRAQDLDFDSQVADLEAVLTAVADRYEPEQLLLFSHSYGGFLSLATLIEAQVPVDGWIDVAGTPTYDEAVQVATRRDFVERVARDFVEQGAPEPVWQEMLDWCLDHPEVLPETAEKDQLWDYMDIIYAHTEGDEPAIGTAALLGAVFFSHYNLFDSHMGSNGVVDNLYSDLVGRDLIDEAAAVDVPSVHVSGQFDDICPTEVTQLMLAQMPTTEAHTLVVAEGAGHSPFIDTPEAFGQAVMDFVEGR